MHDLHIDDFCKDTAKVLLTLYKNFPQMITLYVEDISGEDEADEFGLHSNRHLACFSCIVWLKEADYITFSQPVRQDAFEETCLTHRAFTFLSSPHSVDGNPTSSKRINTLHSTLKNQTSDQLKSLILLYMRESRNYR